MQLEQGTTIPFADRDRDPQLQMETGHRLQLIYRDMQLGGRDTPSKIT